MNCPVCNTIMECRSPLRKNHLDLHCYNDQCFSKEINYRPHVEVILSKPPAPWLLHSYHLPFKEKGIGRDGDSWYVLEGANNETILYDRYAFTMSEKLVFDEAHYPTTGFITLKEDVVNYEMTPLVTINRLMRFTTGKGMYEGVKKLFDEIKRIELYTDYSMDRPYTMPAHTTSTYRSWDDKPVSQPYDHRDYHY